MIKKFANQMGTCTLCDNPFQDVFVYKKMGHLFFIPIIPSNEKYAIKVCTNCHYRYESFDKRYLSIARTPFIFYWFIILVIILIGSMVVLRSQTQREKAAFLENPKVRNGPAAPSTPEIVAFGGEK